MVQLPSFNEGHQVYLPQTINVFYKGEMYEFSWNGETFSSAEIVDSHAHGMKYTLTSIDKEVIQRAYRRLV